MTSAEAAKALRQAAVKECKVKEREVKVSIVLNKGVPKARSHQVEPVRV
jgi:uncharacterized protein GlcG (DUF336 family)